MKQADDPLVSELLETFHRKHTYCEDCWYTCPKHPEGCCNDLINDDCTCGADQHNAALQKFAEKLRARLVQQEESLWEKEGRNQALEEAAKVVISHAKELDSFLEKRISAFDIVLEIRSLKEEKED